MRRGLLICGSSTRAAAASAARAGFRVTTIDAFADVDQDASVRALSISRDFAAPPTAAAMARASRSVVCDTVAYVSPFENHWTAVRTLASGRTLLGNSPDVLRRVRDPFLFTSTLREGGFPVPRLWSPYLPNANVSNVSNDSNDSNDSLLKPLRSGGGRRITRWQGRSFSSRSYVQQRIDGVPGSIVFAAARGECVPLAVSRQLVGDANFGAGGYRYCGSILSRVEGMAVLDAASAIARFLSAEFNLRGINGLDFIVSGKALYALEVNPRWSASVELAERAFGLSCFAAHAAACAGAALPSFDLAAALRQTQAVGKAIVYARRSARCGDTAAWLDDATVADVPRGGERFRAGQPVCTVFATAPDAAACYRALCERAGRVYAELDVTYAPAEAVLR
jgi:predicted ATP-grasp superfamily ATP-dependent carboligase